jgi:predicted GNAT superfamily acetyltransferase
MVSQDVSRRNAMLDRLVLRHARPADHAAVVAVVDEWWGGRLMAAMLPRLFFVHFRETSFVAEVDGELVGFLVGFLSQTFPDEAYIHFVGVRPDQRRAPVARLLYERFFAVVAAKGRRVVRAVTSPANRGSVAFHRAMGFELEPGDGEVDGLPVHTNYDGRGGARVLFVKRL